MGKILFIITLVFSLPLAAKGPKVLKTKIDTKSFFETSRWENDPVLGEKIWTFSFKDDPGYTYEIHYDMTGMFVEMIEKEDGMKSYHYLNRGNQLIHEQDGKLTTYDVDENTGNTLITEIDPDGTRTIGGIPLDMGYRSLSCFSRPRRVGSVMQLFSQFDQLLTPEALNFQEDRGLYQAEGSNILIHESCSDFGDMTNIIGAVERTINTGISCMLRQAVTNYNQAYRSSSSSSRSRDLKKRARNLKRRAASMLGYMAPGHGVKPLLIGCPRPMSANGTAHFCKYEDGTRSPFTQVGYVPSININTLGGPDGFRSAESLGQTLFHEMMHMTGIPHCDRSNPYDQMYGCSACCMSPGINSQVRNQACHQCGAPPMTASDRRANRHCAARDFNIKVFKALRPNHRRRLPSDITCSKEYGQRDNHNDMTLFRDCP